MRIDGFLLPLFYLEVDPTIILELIAVVRNLLAVGVEVFGHATE